VLTLPGTGVVEKEYVFEPRVCATSFSFNKLTSPTTHITHVDEHTHTLSLSLFSTVFRKLDSSKLYIQVCSVDPHLTDEQLKERKTPFQKNTNLKRFIFETPFHTCTLGRLSEYVSMCLCVCVCVCLFVCLCEREFGTSVYCTIELICWSIHSLLSPVHLLSPFSMFSCTSLSSLSLPSLSLDSPSGGSHGQGAE
jgi:DHR-2, Lobe B